ncbi:MAG: hypothetical protein R3194_11170, partial [Limnobacter sp.]|nr:hypothetical protein [Limnobacter sp.]
MISQKAMTGRLLHMRDQVYEQIQNENYQFTVEIGDIAGSQDAVSLVGLLQDLGDVFAEGLTESFDEQELEPFQTRLTAFLGKLTNIMGEPSETNTDNATPNDAYESFRTINGSIDVPCYLNTPGCAPAGSLVYQPDTSGFYGDGLPDAVPMSIMKATFTCRVPKSIFDYTENNGVLEYNYNDVTHPARVSLYGHGLLGSKGEVNNGTHVKWASREANLMFCAMNWTGFATEDVGTAVAGLVDMNNFPRFIDRQLQGMLNWLVLQEAIVAAPGKGGFADQDAFKVNGELVYQLDYTDTGETQGGIFYDGNSQGGIMGGALVAVSPRICKGILGVPGMNYSTLLRRSKDFQAERPIEEGVQQTATSGDLAVGYSDAFDTSYDEPMDQAFLMSLIQMIWDRGETNGYAKFLSPGNALPSHPITGATPGEAQCDKDLLLHVAFGDHQVTHTSAEVMARTAKMVRVENAPGPGRHHD